MADFEQGDALSDSLAMRLDFPAAKTPPTPVKRALAFLAFEGFAIRVGLELSLCVVLFTLSCSLLPVGSLPIPAQWHGLALWFSSCAFVAILDQILLARPSGAIRHVWQLDLAGAYDRALRVLDSIAPQSHAFVRYPAGAYHLTRAQILGHAERFRDAQRELTFAEREGVDQQTLLLIRAEMLRLQGDLDGAKGELALAKLQCGDSPIMSFEEAKLLLSDRSTMREAKRLLGEVANMKPALHPAGDSTALLAQGYAGVAQLWTGEAEEGLDALSECIRRLQMTASYVESIRPILADLYLERSYYLATHREPEGAVNDLKAGLSLCTYPHLRSRANEVKEEIRHRYPAK